MLTEKQFNWQKSTAERLMRWVDGLTPTDYNVARVRIAERWLCIHATGYYSSDSFERFYRKVAEAHHVELPPDYAPGTCLIVTNIITGVGGHARVIDRWIEFDKSRRYSIALLGQNDSPVPPRTYASIAKSGGEVFILNGGDVDKGLKLRHLGSKFETILLVPFPKDVEHIIAFGTKEFKRPVGYYNTADHLFWLGAGVSDAIADLRPWGQEVSFKYRGYSESVIIPVPVENPSSALLGKKDARLALGLDESGQYAVSSARAVKFRSIGDKTFPKRIDGLLDADPDLRVIVIGVGADTFADWGSALRKYDGRLLPIGEVPHEKFLLYQRAADLVIDSYPSGSLTVMEDAVFCGTPILSQSLTFDWLKDSPALAVDTKEFTRVGLKILNDKEYAAGHALEMKKRLVAFAGVETFMARQAEFLNILQSRSHGFTDYVSTPMPYCRWEIGRETAEGATRKERLITGLIIRRPIWLYSFIAVVLSKVIAAIIRKPCI